MKHFMKGFEKRAYTAIGRKVYKKIKKLNINPVDQGVNYIQYKRKKDEQRKQ